MQAQVRIAAPITSYAVLRCHVMCSVAPVHERSNHVTVCKDLLRLHGSMWMARQFIYDVIRTRLYVWVYYRMRDSSLRALGVSRLASAESI